MRVGAAGAGGYGEADHPDVSEDDEVEGAGAAGAGAAKVQGGAALTPEDYFFAFLTITICLLIWEILIGQKPRMIYFFLAGLLVSIAYLTKFAAILFLPVNAISIFYFSLQDCGAFSWDDKAVFSGCFQGGGFFAGYRGIHN